MFFLPCRSLQRHLLNRKNEKYFKLFNDRKKSDSLMSVELLFYRKSLIIDFHVNDYGHRSIDQHEEEGKKAVCFVNVCE